MTKILSLLLALALALAMSIPAFAETHSTAVTYSATGGNYYTVSVPASLVAGGAAGNVILSGALESGKTVTISAPTTVIMQSKGRADVAMPVNFTAVTLTGDETEREVSGEISVELPENAPKFGEWSGSIVYNIEASSGVTEGEGPTAPPANLETLTFRLINIDDDSTMSYSDTGSTVFFTNPAPTAAMWSDLNDNNVCINNDEFQEGYLQADQYGVCINMSDGSGGYDFFKLNTVAGTAQSITGNDTIDPTATYGIRFYPMG